MSAQESMARQSIADFNDGDWEAIRAASAPGIVYRETGTGLRIEGVDALLEALRSWKATFPDLRGEVLRAAEAADTVVIEVGWRGTQTGPLPTPAGDIPASGRTIETLGTMWITYADGLIAAETNHLDLLTLLTGIGAIPAPA